MKLNQKLQAHAIEISHAHIAGIDVFCFFSYKNTCTVDNILNEKEF